MTKVSWYDTRLATVSLTVLKLRYMSDLFKTRGLASLVCKGTEKKTSEQALKTSIPDTTRDSPNFLGSFRAAETVHLCDWRYLSRKRREACKRYACWKLPTLIRQICNSQGLTSVYDIMLLYPFMFCLRKNLLRVKGEQTYLIQDKLY